VSASIAIESSSQEYIVRWNRLVSTTNWEKGRIIHEWRHAMRGENATEDSWTDEAWADRVGQITPQHVGRLRRVWERFGDTYDQYPGLFWSHFQAALNWDDAETWLQGASDERWSVARMRERRWEAHGAPPELKPRPEDIFTAEVDEDVDPRVEAPTSTSHDIAPTEGEVRDIDDEFSDDEFSGNGHRDENAAEQADEPESAAREMDDATPVQPFRDLPELPEDVDQALEGMKLAIIAHKASSWERISRDDMLRVIDGLRALVLAPA